MIIIIIIIINIVTIFIQVQRIELRESLRSCEGLLGELSVKGKQSQSKLEELKVIMKEFQGDRSDEAICQAGVSTIEIFLGRNPYLKENDIFKQLEKQPLDSIKTAVRRIHAKCGMFLVNT